MNRILFIIGLIAAFQIPSQAQDAALVERVNRLSVLVEDLWADKARAQKQITDLQREVDSLKQEIRALKGGATQQEISDLAESIRQVERKQRENMELVAKKIEDLGKKAASQRSTPSTSGQTRSQPGWDYTVQQGNTLSAIAQAFRDKYGVKTTADDILKANPALQADKLQINQEVFVPEIR